MSTLVKQKSEKRRSFGGKTENFVDNKERNFEKAHLKAYLAGKKQFKHGFDLMKNPVTHPVKVIWTPISDGQ
jgi:hypothetical protein